eukprot:TRINITY_DN2273_c0_g1_i1.p1 TRINITY_DN2273_c0_g1~~TRINITY_DN2273_c0_g1_i1.p1  ORF type:complete len:442 (-),score=91.00 TRINITY_DN2273_c0_g1_i1:342-1541(-)
MTTPGVPLGAPPGLEPDIDAASFAANVAVASPAPSKLLQAVEAKLKELVPDAPQQAIVEAMRESLIMELESKVKERTEELWSKGRQLVGQMQQRHKEHAQQLTSDLDKRRVRQQELEAENAKLKQTLQGMAARLVVLGQGSLGSLGTFPEETQSQGSPMEAFSSLSPASLSAPTAGCETPKLLPSVPAFPFPSSVGPPAALFSLSEALGQRTPPPRQPLSLASSLTPPQTPVMPSPFTTNGQVGLGLLGGSGIFSFTLRKADGTELGLNVSHCEEDHCLHVEGVRPDGAVDAWNKQCLGSTSAHKAIIPGDRIICVNKVYYDTAKMLEECRDKQLLKLTIARGDVPLPPAPSPEGLQSPGKRELRADASVFVPTTSAQESGVARTGSGTSLAPSETKEK